MSEREKFEARAKEHTGMYLDTKSNGEYVSLITFLAFEAWQAAKADAVPEWYVLINKNDLKMELCSIRTFNCGEHEKPMIEECICNIESMIESQEQ